MARYVVKFGGTSVGNIDRIQHAASIISKLAHAGHEIAVVVSAMAGMTNQLIAYANTLNPQHTPEHDVVTTSGEQITAGLMALALQKYGLKAQSFLAWQIAIETDTNHGDATILNIPPEKFENCFAQSIIPVVAGFQGLTSHHRLTTLGRGGSDTTAVALSAAIKADSCYIYTDVEGVYTADPRIVPKAKKIETISYSAMLGLSTHGAKVLHARCVELGKQHNVNLHVLSSFVSTPGTRISPMTENIQKISGITHSLNEIYICLKGTVQQIQEAKNALKTANILIDMETQLTSDTLHYTIAKADLDRTKTILSELKLAIDPNIVKISIIGVGIKHDLSIEALAHKVLAAHQINVHLASRSDIKLSFVIAHDQMTKAISVLHDTLIINDQNEPLN